MSELLTEISPPAPAETELLQDVPAERPRPTPEPASVHRWAVLPAASRAALLFGGMGLTCVLGAYLAANMSLVPDFVASNALDWETRKLLTGAAGVAAVSGLLLPLLVWLFRPGAAPRLESMGRRLSPLIPLSFLPTISHWDAWDDRPFVHLAFVSLLTFGLYRAVLVAQGEPRIVRRLPGEGLIARLAETAFARHLPAALVFAGAAGYAAYFSYYTLLAHDHGRTFAFDLGIFDNLQWQILHGTGFMRSTPGMGPELSHFGRHATMLAFLFTPIYALHEGSETLLVLQATLLGAGAIPLFYFAKRHTTPWAACVLALAYVSYAPLHGSNSYDFHHLAISPVFVFALALAVETEKAWAIVLATTLTLACREDVAPAVAILGAYHVLAGTKPRLGLALVLVGGVYFVAMKFVLMPLAEGGESFADIYRALIPEGGHGLRGVLTSMGSNPAFTFSLVPQVPKLTYVLHMLVPVAFLVVRRPLGLLFLLPGVFFTVLSNDFFPHVTLSFQYTAFWTPYVFVASAFFLGEDSLGRALGVDVTRTRRALVCAVALAAWATSYQWGGLLQHHTMGSGFWAHFTFEPTPAQIEAREAREAIFAQIPRDAAVAASETMVPHLSARSRIYTLRGAVFDAEYVVAAVRDIGPLERQTIGEELKRGTMGLVEENRYFVLLRRGAPTDENARIYRRVVRRRMPKPEPAADPAPAR